MLQTMVSLVDPERTIHVQVHDGLVDLALAALSAEPVSIDELRVAMGRYMEPAVVEFFFAGAAGGLATRRLEGGHVIIDFTARLVVNGSAAPEMPRLGCVLCCDEHTTLDVWLPYRIPEQWQMTADTRTWEQLAARRRPAFSQDSAVDARAVLYPQLARALLERHIAMIGLPGSSVTEIQDWWLLTPRADLRGKTPREVLLTHRRVIDGDVQDQGEIWSLLGRCPPGLPLRAHAYRYAGFGTQEIILYHELVAVLLCEIERRIGEQPPADLRREITRLEQFQQEWMHQPQSDLYDQSPAALIARERARLPAVIPKGHEQLDHDCPLCRMMADSGQPMIWQLDNYLLEQRFSTSLCASRAEWEQNQAEMDEPNPVQDPAGPAALPSGLADDRRVWQNSFTNMASLADMPPGEAANVMLFAVGGHLAELVHDLRARPADDELVEALHIRFDELRVVVKDQRELCTVRGAIGEFAEALHDTARLCSELSDKCRDLEAKAEFLERRYAEHLGQDLETPH
jgi:hypothetical protein